MTNRTVGSWVQQWPAFCEVHDAEGKVVALTLNDQAEHLLSVLPEPIEVPGLAESNNNARLIAAAPDLLHSLNLALEYWAHRMQRYNNRHPVWVQEARKAIAKAKGEPS